MKFYKALVEIYEDGPWTKWVVLKADYLAAEKGWKDHNAEIVAENVKIRGIVDDIRIDYLEHTLAEKDNDIQLLGDSLNGLNEQIAALTAERDRLREALEEIAPFLCRAICPTTWKTGEARPHDELCVLVQATLKGRVNNAGTMVEASME